MRLLVVTNLYPPHHIGGYELGCRDIVEGLKSRGHQVQVLTSSFGTELEASTAEPGVDRSLRFFARSEEGRHDKLREVLCLLRALRLHRPEVVYFWNQAGLSHWLPVVAWVLRYRCAYFLSDTNFVAWRVGAFLARWAEPAHHGLVGRVIQGLLGETFLVEGASVLRGQVCHFASDFLRKWADRAGIDYDRKHSAVIHWGIDPAIFSAEHEPRWPPRRLLYVGQLIPQKGVHTVIKVLGAIATEASLPRFELTVVGGGLHPDYEATLRALPAELGIGDRVHFLGKVPRGELPAIYAVHDVLVFPSEWEEPFAITPLEAMAAGLGVVGTATGGSGELMVNNETALVYEAGSIQDGVRVLKELVADEAGAKARALRGQREVLRRHTMTGMIERIETLLESEVSSIAR